MEQRLAAAGDVGFYSEDRGLVRLRPAARVPRDRPGRRHPARGRGARVVLRVDRGRAADEDARARRRVVRRRARAEDRRSGSRPTRGDGARRGDRDGTPIPIAPSANTDLGALFWTAGLRGRPSLPTSVVLEELVDGSSMGGGYFDLGSAAFNLTRIVTGQLDAYVDVGRRIVDEFPEHRGRVPRGSGRARCARTSPTTSPPRALIVQEAGGVVTHADGRPLADHPAIGSCRARGLAVLAAASPELHERLLAAVDRGMSAPGGAGSGPVLRPSCPGAAVARASMIAP